MRDLSGGIVVLTQEQLRILVSEAVEEALAKAASGAAPGEVLSCEQAAELIGVHPHTVPKLVRDEGLPTLRRIGKLWRFRRSDVMAWLGQKKSA